MPFSAGSITSALGLDTSGFSQGMLSATAIAQTFPNVVTSFLANPVLGVVNVFGTAFNAITGIVSSAMDTVKQAFDDSFKEADKLNDLATNAGVSAEQLSGLGLVAKQSGSSVDEVAESFKFLGKNVSDAMSGNKQVIGDFQRFGVAFQDATGRARPLNDVMLDVADAIAALPPGAEQTGAAMTLLNRGGAGMIATLGQGSGAIKEQIDLYTRLGAVVTTRAAESANAYGDVLGELQMAWRGVQNAIGDPLREALTPALRMAADWIARNMPQIQQTIREVIGSVIEWTAKAADAVAEHWPEIQAVVQMVWEGVKFGVSGLAEEFAAMVKMVESSLSTVLHTFEFVGGALEKMIPDLVGGEKLRDFSAGAGTIAMRLDENMAGRRGANGPGRFETAARQWRSSLGDDGTLGDFSDGTLGDFSTGGVASSIGQLGKAAQSAARSIDPLPSVIPISQLNDFKASLKDTTRQQSTNATQQFSVTTTQATQTMSTLQSAIDGTSRAFTRLTQIIESMLGREQQTTASAQADSSFAPRPSITVGKVDVTVTPDQKDIAAAIAPHIATAIEREKERATSSLRSYMRMQDVAGGL